MKISAGAPSAICLASAELAAYEIAVVLPVSVFQLPAISSSAFFRLAAAKITTSSANAIDAPTGESRRAVANAIPPNPLRTQANPRPKTLDFMLSPVDRYFRWNITVGGLRASVIFRWDRRSGARQAMISGPRDHRAESTTASASISTSYSPTRSAISISVLAGRIVAEISAMHARDRLPLLDVAQIDARAHDILEAAAERAKARGDLVEDVDRLPARVALADDLAAAVGRRRAADQDAVADPDRAAVAADALPDAAAVDAQPGRAAGHRNGA